MSVEARPRSTTSVPSERAPRATASTVRRRTPHVPGHQEGRGTGEPGDGHADGAELEGVEVIGDDAPDVVRLEHVGEGGHGRPILGQPPVTGSGRDPHRARRPDSLARSAASPDRHRREGGRGPGRPGGGPGRDGDRLPGGAGPGAVPPPTAPTPGQPVPTRSGAPIWSSPRRPTPSGTATGSPPVTVASSPSGRRSRAPPAT